MKKIYLLILLFNSYTFFSQEKIGEYNNNLKENSSQILESFTIVNNENKDIASFLLEKKHIYGYLLDSTFNIKKSLSSEDKRRKYIISLGKMYDGSSNYKIVVTDKKRKKYAVIHFNFNENKVDIFEDTFNNKKLVFLQSISRKNKIHLLFLNRLTSNIISRTYDISGNINNTLFDLSNEQFLIDDKREIKLNKLITDFSKPNAREIENIVYELTKINEENYTSQIKEVFFTNSIKRTQTPPSSIETSVRLNKLYINKKDIIITLDKNRFYTQILRLNLNNGSHEFHKIKKPLFDLKKTEKRSNSFLNDNLIFTIASNKNKISIDILDFKKNSIIKQLAIQKDTPIDFKNTPIIQRGASFDKYREFEKSNTFLRKATDSQIGICVHKNKKGYELTIGGISEGLKTTQIVGAVATTVLLGNGGNMGGLNFLRSFQEGGFFNPYPKSFNDYSRTKSIRFKSLFDEDFNHLKGEIKKNSFDKIGDFLGKKEISKKTATSIFPMDNYLIFGAYSKKTKTYSYYKFEN